MVNTRLAIKGQDFYINGKLTYSEIENADRDVQGLLMNARFIQGVFDDKIDRSRFNRFGKIFDPDKNTDDLIAALPEWYNHGLRAFTVGLQGGWPVFTIMVDEIDNNPFGKDGKLDKAYADRLDRVIRAADSLGIVVIVNILYWAQANHLYDGVAIKNSIKNTASFLRENGYTNVIIDVANEFNIDRWEKHNFIRSPETIQLLINLAREESGGLPVGCSGGGGYFNKKVAEVSDVVLIHGNGLTQGKYYDLIKKTQEIAPDKPILCNEDSPCFTRLDVARLTHTTWGHYDNFTKQEPPCDWGITPGQDTFYARRMARTVGIKMPDLPLEEQFYLQGLEENTEWQGKRWIHLAAEYPERVKFVDFFRNDNFIYRSYDEPFFLFRETTWIQKPWKVTADDREWAVEIVLNNGEVIRKTVEV